MIRPILNLLSPEEQALIGQEKISRLLFAFFGITALLIAVGSVLLLPSFFFLSLKEPSILRQIALSKQSVEAGRVRQAEDTIHTTNEQLTTLFAENISATAPLSTYLRPIADRTSPAIDIDTILFEGEKNTIAIRGIALSRNDFLSFIRLLENYPAFSSVDSPVANLLREHDLLFNITIFIKEPDEEA